MLSVESFSRAQRRLHPRPAPRLPKLLPIPYTSPVDLFSPDLRRNPYPAYAHMREASPVFREPTSGLWLVFRYADVKRVLTDHQAFSSRAGPPVWMLFQDPPRHSRMRALIAQAFTPGSIEALEGGIRTLTRELLDAKLPA